MTKKATIPKIMKRHHFLLEGMLNRIIKSQNEPDIFPKKFNKFKWELEKHFFIEEKAIFIFINSKNQEIYETSEILIKDHRLILAKLNEIEKILKVGKTVDFSDLKNLLIKHRDLEDESFYPRLEDELDQEQKEDIISRITTPI